MSNTAICPGSFDPLTNGHLDIILRSAKIFSKVIVAVIENPDKKNPLFEINERVNLIKQVLKDYNNIEVKSFRGLLADFMNENDAKIIIKGIRTMSDYEYEFQMASFNSKINPNIETLFLSSRAEYSFLSSSAVKQLALLGGNIEDYVPMEISNEIYKKIKAIKSF